MELGSRLKTVQAVLNGSRRVILEGEEICFWALGSFLETAKEIADFISQNYGFSPTIVDPRFVKPLDDSLLKKHATSHQAIVTFEDNVLAGGFGSAVLESLESLTENLLLKELAGQMNLLSMEARSILCVKNICSITNVFSKMLKFFFKN